jgi:hypothetical protein
MCNFHFNALILELCHHLTESVEDQAKPSCNKYMSCRRILLQGNFASNKSLLPVVRWASRISPLILSALSHYDCKVLSMQHVMTVLCYAQVIISVVWHVTYYCVFVRFGFLTFLRRLHFLIRQSVKWFAQCMSVVLFERLQELRSLLVDVSP